MKFNHEDWLRLGRAVYTSRLRAGHTETAAWAAVVGRSSRVLLGLERGESVGNNTLDRIAAVLNWPAERPYEILANTPAQPETTSSTTTNVSGTDDDPGIRTIKARKPANMSDEDFKRLIEEYREEIEWKLDRAARER